MHLYSLHPRDLSYIKAAVDSPIVPLEVKDNDYIQKNKVTNDSIKDSWSATHCRNVGTLCFPNA
jgi:hypothetical protein